MKKKGMEIVSGILLVIVVVVAASITFSFIVGPNSPSNWLMDYINKYTYKESWNSLNDAQDTISDILIQKTEKECDSTAQKAITMLEKEGLRLPEDATYMHTKIASLRSEIEASRHFCKGKVKFDAAQYSGKNDDFLDPAKSEFEQVSGRKEFEAVQLADKYLRDIKHILACEEHICDNGPKKGHCVSFYYNDKKYCRKASAQSANFFGIPKAREEYCEAIKYQTRNAYKEINSKREYVICLACEETTTCEDYKYNKDACIQEFKTDTRDVCGVGPCEFPLGIGSTSAGTIDEGPCREAGSGVICSDHEDESSCEADSENHCLWVLGPGYQPLPQHRVYGEDVRCISCDEINTCEDYGTMYPRAPPEYFDFCLEDGCYEKYGASLGRNMLTCKVYQQPAPSEDKLYPKKCVSEEEKCSNFNNEKEKCLSKDYCYYVAGFTNEGGPFGGYCKDCDELQSCSEIGSTPITSSIVSYNWPACTGICSGKGFNCVAAPYRDKEGTSIIGVRCTDCNDPAICGYSDVMMRCPNSEELCGMPADTDFPDVK